MDWPQVFEATHADKDEKKEKEKKKPRATHSYKVLHSYANRVLYSETWDATEVHAELTVMFMEAVWDHLCFVTYHAGSTLSEIGVQ